MGLAKIRITHEFIDTVGINAKLFGQIFLNLPEGTLLKNVVNVDLCTEFHFSHNSFKEGGEITPMFNRTAYRGPADDYAYKYIDQFIGLDFSYAIEKL